MALAILFLVLSWGSQPGLKKGAEAPRGDVTREDPRNEERANNYSPLQPLCQLVANFHIRIVGGIVGAKNLSPSLEILIFLLQKKN
jgi:hypothetical protein